MGGLAAMEPLEPLRTEGITPVTYEEGHSVVVPSNYVCAYPGAQSSVGGEWVRGARSACGFHSPDSTDARSRFLNHGQLRGIRTLKSKRIRESIPQTPRSLNR